MKKNVGSTDRVIRLIAAAIFAYLYFSGTVAGTAGIVLVVLAVIFALTSLVGFCPIYAIFGLNSCKTKPTTKQG